jgi:hypothetical protein
MGMEWKCFFVCLPHLPYYYLLLFRFDQGHRVHSTEYASLYRTDIPGDGKFLGHMNDTCGILSVYSSMQLRDLNPCLDSPSSSNNN